MPQIVAIALLGAGLYAGYRWASRQLAEAKAAAMRAEAERQRRAHETDREPRNLGALELDPESGVYRPRSS